jgi:hypothetical protein
MKGKIMVKISEAAVQKAFELAKERGHADIPCSAIEALAAYIQQVSDAAKNYGPKSLMAPFILPDPVDPLEELGHGCIVTSSGKLDVNFLKKLLMGKIKWH